MSNLYIGSASNGASSMAASLDRKGGSIMSNRHNPSSMSSGMGNMAMQELRTGADITLGMKTLVGAFGQSAVQNLVGAYGASAVANLAGAVAAGVRAGPGVGSMMSRSAIGAERRGPRVGSMMSRSVIGAMMSRNLIGSLNDGSSSMAVNYDRKGTTIMSNRRRTSDMIGRHDHIYIGADGTPTEPVQGPTAPPATKAEAKAVIAEAKKSDDPAVIKAVAALQIDARIMGVLKPQYAAYYSSAANGKSRDHFLSSAVCLLLAMVSDTGVSGMVTSVDAAKAQFGELGYLQRAIFRRLSERDEFMKRGWLSRLFGDAEKRTDFDPLK